MKNPDEKKQEAQDVPANRLRKYAAVLLFALIVVVAIDGYFSNWSIFRTLSALNTLELHDNEGQSWQLVDRNDFQLAQIKDVRTVVDTDSLLAFDKTYRDAGYYRLYFRHSDSSSTKLQKLYQTLLTLDTTESIKHTVDDAQRAYQNLQRILRFSRPVVRDTGTVVKSDSTVRVKESDVALGAGDETMAVVRKIVSDPHILAGVGIGIVASAGLDLLRGNAYVAVSKRDVFRLDSIKVGSRVATWEGAPIDILWVFGQQDTATTQEEQGAMKN